MKLRRGLAVVGAVLGTITLSAAAQQQSISGDSSQLLLYALGLVNTLLMLLLSFHMAQAARARSARDQEINESMKSVSSDLKKLNDAVLGQYCTKEMLETIVAQLKDDLKEEAKLRRESDHSMRGDLHRFELALVSHNMKIEPSAVTGGPKV